MFYVRCCALALLQLVSTYATADLSIISSTGVSSIMHELIPAYERATGQRVSISYDTSNIIMDRLKRGESADLVILTAPLIDNLTQQGRLQAGSRTDMAKSGIGVAVKAGAPRPDISSVEAFRQTLLDTPSVAFTGTGASGQYFAGLVEKMGIGAEVKQKAKIPAGGLVAELVVKGEAALAIQMISELKAVPGADYVGPLPAPMQLYTVFSAGLMAQAKDPAAAKLMLDFMKKPQAQAIYLAKGMETVGRIND
jgi:molybdate transport system substrate-binding protein